MSPENAREVERVNRGTTIAWGDGTSYDLANPNPEIISLEDYAYALAFSCRFRGQTRYPDGPRVRAFYGVGQHVVFGTEEMLALRMPEEHARAFLFHESGEVPWGDFPGPGKAMFPGLRDREKQHEAAISARFGVTTPDPDLIKRWDLRMFWTEARDLLPGWRPHNSSDPSFEPFGRTIVPYGHPERAAVRFLELCDQLGVKE